MNRRSRDNYDNARENAILAAISDLRSGRFKSIDDAAWVYDLADYTVWARLRELGICDQIVQVCRRVEQERLHDPTLDQNIEAAVDDLKSRRYTSITAAARSNNVNDHLLRCRLRFLGMYDRVVRQCKDARVDLDVEAAIFDLRTGRFGILRHAAQAHGISCNTLRYHLQSRGVYHQFIERYNYFESSDGSRN